jgi:hypothetical protein
MSCSASEGNWFFVIAGLSLLNALLPRIGLPVFFIAALAAPILVSNYAHLVSSSLSMAQADWLSYGALALCIATLAALGWFARKGHAWAFAVGGVLYLADGIVFLRYGDYPSFILHVVVLYFIFRGFLAVLRSRPAVAAPAPSDVEPEPSPAPPAQPRKSAPSRPGSLYPY